MKPILFNGDMVRALLDGSKTQTRRTLKCQPPEWANHAELLSDGICYEFWDSECLNTDFLWPEDMAGVKPKYQAGDVLYVRERARLIDYDFTTLHDLDRGKYIYEADKTVTDWICIPDRLAMPIKGDCCPNGCFKELARIFLKVKVVRIERIRDISYDDSIAEGFKGGNRCSPIKAFVNTWEDYYPKSWERNDWVVVHELERVIK